MELEKWAGRGAILLPPDYIQLRLSVQLSRQECDDLDRPYIHADPDLAIRLALIYVRLMSRIRSGELDDELSDSDDGEDEGDLGVAYGWEDEADFADDEVGSEEDVEMDLEG